MRIRRGALPWLAVVLTAATAPAIVRAQEPAALSVDRITSSAPSIAGTSPTRPTWSPDSRWLAFLWNDQARPGRDLWVVGARESAPRRVTRTLDATSGPRGIGDFTWTPDGAAIVYLHGGDVWRVALDGGTPERLTTNGGSKSEVGLSPDGKIVSFLQGGDLWLRYMATGDLVQATRVGVAPRGTVPLGTYYRPDVEIGRYTWGGDTPAYAWSPDGAYIAVQYVDRRKVRETPYPYYLGEETVANIHRRGYPGDDNEIRTIGFYGVASGSLRLVDLPSPESIQILDFSWSPQGVLLVDREADIAVDRWLVTIDPASLEQREVWHDHRDSRVYNAIASSWHSDGKRVVMISDLDDRYRLYTVTPGNRTPKTLTTGAWDVTGGPILNGPTRSLFYVSSEASPYERHVYRMSDEGGPATRLTARPGTYTPFVSPDGSAVALLCSDDVTPPDLYVIDAKGGSAERRITKSPPPEFAAVNWVRPRYTTFKSRTPGIVLHARIIEPANLDRSRRHPIVFGPIYSNTVRNRWNGLYGMLQQLLVSRGYIVAQVDVRGSTGYGRDFREGFLKDWGGKDLDDLEDVVKAMKAEPYVDGQRAGVWGSSYGGLMTVFALFKKPGLFAAGVAGAAAVDPRFFGADDVAITRRPQSDPEAFRRGNASEYAANLKDHLLFIHGMQDDVVPFKTVVALAEQLIKLGKDFDFAFAPAATHGWTQREDYARYLLGKLLQHFDRYLATPPREATASASVK